MKLIKNIEDILFFREPTSHLESLKNDYSFTTDSIAVRTWSEDKELDRSSLKTEKDDEWLTTVEAAEYFKLSVGSFRNLVSDGHIPHYKLGRRNRYLRCELRNLLSADARGRAYYDKIK